MPMQPQALPQERNVTARLVHATKSNSPEEPIQFAFSVTDENGSEQIVNAEIPSGIELYETFVEQGWLTGRGVATRRLRRTA